MNKEILLTVAQVSERLRTEERTVTRWLRTGHLRGYKLGGVWRVAPDDLDGFLKSPADRPRKDGVAHPGRKCRGPRARRSDITADVAPSAIQIQAFEFQPIQDASYLKVHTYPRPTDRTVRLALIEWIEDGYATYKRLVNRKPMSHSEAMEYAKRFAEKFEVPVIYQREDGQVNC